MRLLVLLFALSLCYYCSFAQTVVPLVPLDGSNVTLQVGGFTPNGTLSGGSTVYFRTNVQGVPSDFAFSVYLETLALVRNNSDNSSSSSDDNEFYSVHLYLKKGQSPSALSYDAYNSFYCTNSSCHPLEWMGICGPSNGDYYFSVYNPNIFEIYYQLSIAVDDQSDNLACILPDAAGFFTTLVIIIFVVVGAVVLGGVICVVVCCCCCVGAGAAAAAAAASSRSGVPTTTVVQHSYAPVPQNPPGAYYPAQPVN